MYSGLAYFLFYRAPHKRELYTRAVAYYDSEMFSCIYGYNHDHVIAVDMRRPLFNTAGQIAVVVILSRLLHSPCG